MSYKTDINHLKMIIFLKILIFLNLSLSKNTFMFFLVVLTVTIKNMLFWGLTKFVFLNLYVLYFICAIILLYSVIKIIKDYFFIQNNLY
jgi:hypothetical protein